MSIDPLPSMFGQGANSPSPESSSLDALMAATQSAETRFASPRGLPEIREPLNTPVFANNDDLKFG